eukprot:Mrub_01298.p2 GENE.Mrub_01298~~Mrub_01298.p2  ORF type:complete len:166 (-),score=8.22 Mrub_01298:126-623(-)
MIKKPDDNIYLLRFSTNLSMTNLYYTERNMIKKLDDNNYLLEFSNVFYMTNLYYRVNYYSTEIYYPDKSRDRIQISKKWNKYLVSQKAQGLLENAGFLQVDQNTLETQLLAEECTPRSKKTNLINLIYYFIAVVIIILVIFVILVCFYFNYKENNQITVEDRNKN